MNRILAVIQKKSTTEALVSLVYFVMIGLFKWQLSPSAPTLFFFTGAVLGIYFLEIAEEFFNLTPSPFRSIVFAAGLVLVSLFVITSTASMLGMGLVLSLSLTLLLWQVKEWRTAGNLNQWYVMISGPVAHTIQRLILAGFALVFFIETFLFLR